MARSLPAAAVLRQQIASMNTHNTFVTYIILASLSTKTNLLIKMQSLPSNKYVAVRGFVCVNRMGS